MSQIYCSTVGCRRTAHGLRGEYGKPLCAVCHQVYEDARANADRLILDATRQSVQDAITTYQNSQKGL